MGVSRVIRFSAHYYHQRHTRKTNTTTTTTLEFLTRDWIFFRCARLVRRTGGRQNKRVWKRWRALGEGGWRWLQPPVKQKNRHGNQAPSPSAEGTLFDGGVATRPRKGCPRGLYWILRKFPPAEKIHATEGVISRGEKYRLILLSLAEILLSMENLMSSNEDVWFDFVNHLLSLRFSVKITSTYRCSRVSYLWRV